MKCSVVPFSRSEEAGGQKKNRPGLTLSKEGMMQRAVFSLFLSLALVVGLGFTVETGWAQIGVSMDSVNVLAGDTVDVDVNIDSTLFTTDGVMSVDLTVSFDTSVVEFIEAFEGADFSTLIDTFLVNDTVRDTILIGAASSTYLTGAGALLTLRFAVVGDATDSTDLVFEDFMFNEGAPYPSPLTDGLVAVLGLSISGTISYYADGAGGEPPAVSGATVNLLGTDIYGEAVDLYDTTDATGAYSFDNLNPSSASSYTITPTRSLLPAVDNITISTYDAALAIRQSVKLDTPVTGDFFAAGDVSYNGTITSYDGAGILHWIVSDTAWMPFPVAVTVNSSFDFFFRPITRSPGDLSANDSTVVLTTTDIYGVNFTALAFGDLSANWDPGNETGFKVVAGIGRTVSLARGANPNVVEVRIDDASELYSGYLALDLDTQAWPVVDVRLGELALEESDLAYNMRDGQLLIAFAGAEPLSGSGALVEIQLQERAGGVPTIALAEVLLDEGRIPALIDRAFQAPALPGAYALAQNYPNPFNPETEIPYALPADGQVRLAIYNLLGQEVRILVDGFQTAGFHSIRWDGRDNLGRLLSSGVYLYRLRAGDYIQTRRMILLK